MGSNVPLSGMTAQYLPKRLNGRKRMSMVRATSTLRRISCLQKIESLNLDPRLKNLLLTYEGVLGALPPPLSCKKLVQMDLKLKPEFEKTRVRRRSYPAPQEQDEEIERQIQECIDAGLVEEYKKGDYPLHCSPCFLVAKPGSTALRPVVDYDEVTKKAQNHPRSVPNMENTLVRFAKCRYKAQSDKRTGFWHVDLTAVAEELLAFITPKGRVFKWKVMPFGMPNAPALFQEVMNKILYILLRRPLVHEHTHTPTTQPRGVQHSRNLSPARTPTPRSPARNGGVQAGCPNKHTHAPTPQPGVAGRGSNPGPSTQNRTPPPARRCRGPRGKGTQTHTHPHTSPGSGGAQPKPKPKHTRPHRTPEPGTAEYSRSAHIATHPPKPQPQMVGCRPKPKPNCKPRQRQPGEEGRNLNPYPNTANHDPSQGWRAYRSPNPRTTRTHTQTPHKNRKPSVHSPGT